MPSFRDVVRSSIGKKLVSGFTGLCLCVFVTGHLIGNLLLIVGPEAFNEYAHFLENFGHGYAVYLAEVGLIAVFLFHAVAGIQVALDRRRARPSRYAVRADAGGASRKTLSSRSMILTGIVLLVFVPVHVWMFKFGPGIAAGYATTVAGEPFRDLYKLVVEWFQNPLVVAIYVAVMVLLGTHLRHGFWSAFQSLGASNPKFMPLISAVGVVFAIAIAVGFLFLPIYLFLFAGPAMSSMVAG